MEFSALEDWKVVQGVVDSKLSNRDIQQQDGPFCSRGSLNSKAIMSPGPRPSSRLRECNRRFVPGQLAPPIAPPVVIDAESHPVQRLGVAACFLSIIGPHCITQPALPLAPIMVGNPRRVKTFKKMFILRRGRVSSCRGYILVYRKSDTPNCRS